MIHFDDNRSSIIVAYSEGGVRDKLRNYKLSANTGNAAILSADRQNHGLLGSVGGWTAAEQISL